MYSTARTADGLLEDVALAPSVNLGAVLRKLDDDFAAQAPHAIERFCFDLDGIGFDVRRVPHQNRARFLITAALGFLPFTIEFAARRDAILSILSSTQTLPRVRFAVDASSKITAAGVFDCLPVSPDTIFYPIIQFLQETRPFMRLIGAYLF